MKKILYAWLFLIFPMSVYADSINLNCPTEVKPNSEFTCTVTGNSTSINVSSLEAKINAFGQVSFVQFIPDKIWQGDGEDGYITIYSDNNFTGAFNIGTLKLKSSNEGTGSVTIDQGVFLDRKDQVSLSNVTKEISVKKEEIKQEEPNKTENKTDNTSKTTTNNDASSNTDTADSSNLLTDIIIKNYTLNFSKNTFNYNLTIGDDDTLDIQPILEDSNSSFEIVGNNNLSDNSVISIIVTSKNNVKNTYTINIHKETITENVDNSTNNNGNNKNNMLFIIIIGVLVIINILRIVINNKKKANGDS